MPWRYPWLYGDMCRAKVSVVVWALMPCHGGVRGCVGTRAMPRCPWPYGDACCAIEVSMVVAARVPPCWVVHSCTGTRAILPGVCTVIRWTRAVPSGVHGHTWTGATPLWCPHPHRETRAASRRCAWSYGDVCHAVGCARSHGAHGCTCSYGGHVPRRPAVHPCTVSVPRCRGVPAHHAAPTRWHATPERHRGPRRDLGVTSPAGSRCKTVLAFATMMSPSTRQGRGHRDTSLACVNLLPSRCQACFESWTQGSG